MTTRRIWLEPPASSRGARRIDIRPGRWFTTLDLDRDDHVSRARADGRLEDADLRPGFQEVLTRVMDAACNYLWVNGYPGDFSYSQGPSIVTLFVPFSLADEAGEALRAAEVTGDMIKLDAIAAKLAIPLGDWLAPGERELRQGIDFTASPSGFLKFLRGKASVRGLRLNGRAVPGGVWVRPQMAVLARELRTRYPDRYPQYADPAAYAAHHASDDELPRPYVGGRTQVRSGEVAPVAFLETPARSREDRECPCGVHAPWAEYNAARHVQAHMRWSTGVAFPHDLIWHGGNIAVVTATSPVRWRKLGYQCALLPKRENGYDFASFDVGDGEPSEGNLRAYLYRADERVIGFASVADTTQQWWRSFDSKEKPRPGVGSSRPVVNVIFAADTWRRRGIARDMVEAIARDSGVAVADVAWSGPFSESGLALAKSFNPTGAWMA